MIAQTWKSVNSISWPPRLTQVGLNQMGQWGTIPKTFVVTLDGDISSFLKGCSTGRMQNRRSWYLRREPGWRWSWRRGSQSWDGEADPGCHCLKPWIQLLMSLSTFVLLNHRHWLIAFACCIPFELGFCQLWLEASWLGGGEGREGLGVWD